MKTLKDVVATKGTEVFAVTPGDSAFDVIRVMNEKGVGALLVMDGDRLTGIVSERDIARKVTLAEKGARQTHCSEIMTGDVTCAQPTLTVKEGMEVMTEKRIRHLPVVDGGRVVGIVSIGDLVKAIIDEQQFTITQLEQYIIS